MLLGKNIDQNYLSSSIIKEMMKVLYRKVKSQLSWWLVMQHHLKLRPVWTPDRAHADHGQLLIESALHSLHSLIGWDERLCRHYLASLARLQRNSQFVACLSNFLFSFNILLLCLIWYHHVVFFWKKKQTCMSEIKDLGCLWLCYIATVLRLHQIDFVFLVTFSCEIRWLWTAIREKQLNFFW